MRCAYQFLIRGFVQVEMIPQAENALSLDLHPRNILDQHVQLDRMHKFSRSHSQEEETSNVYQKP